MRKFIKNTRSFFIEYKQFGFVLVTIISALALQLAGQKTAADIVLIASIVINVVPLVYGMIQDLRSGIYGVDILAATAIISAVLFKEYWAGMVIVLMLTGGEALEDHAEKRAKTELSALLDRAPAKAHVLRGRKEIDIPVKQVRVGDKLVIKPGEMVPVDAVILEGSANFDESSLTGESLPMARSVGDDILSGSINVDGALTVKASRIADESQYQQIIKLVKIAEASRAPFVRLADRYSVPFTLLAFTIAIGAWAISGESIRFLEVLVVATPCPLILGAPIALISGMSLSARHGIIVKTGGALEQLATAKTIGFDKTGTLTKGQPVAKDVVAFGSFDKKTVVSAAASIEMNSIHVLAKAITDKATSMKIKPAKSKNVEEISGKGLRATVGGKPVLLGRLSLMEENNVSLPKNFSKASIGQTASFVAINNELAGYITFEDELRPEAKQTLSRLKKLGIKHMLMVTGDNSKTAQAIARKLGIEQVEADALPGDKLRAIENVAHKPVAFIGDGVNDAPVLTAASVGVALGARGSTAASESADVVIMTDNFAQVATSIQIAKRTLRIAKQSILTGIFLSIILMLIFATGRFRAVQGALIQEVVDVVVIVYALRAHSDRWLKKLAKAS